MVVREARQTFQNISRDSLLRSGVSLGHYYALLNTYQGTKQGSELSVI